MGKLSQRLSAWEDCSVYTASKILSCFTLLKNLIHTLWALLLLWHLWLLILVYTLLTPISVTAILCTCHPRLPPHPATLARHSAVCSTPLSLCSLEEIMRVSPSECNPFPLLPLCAVGKRVPAVAVTTAPLSSSSGERLGTASARSLISSSHLLPLCGLWF